MDPKENSGAMNFFGVDASKTPCVLVHDPKNDAKYNSGVIEPSKIQKFVEDFKAGKIERTIKSADEPESNDGPVKIVTAKSLKTVVDGSKNVLIGAHLSLRPWPSKLLVADIAPHLVRDQWSPMSQCDTSATFVMTV